MRDFRPAIAALLLALTMQGCFTGVESTPRISYSEVKKEHITAQPEQSFLDDVAAVPVGRWEAGKAFYVTDPKISLILSVEPGAAIPQAGELLRYVRLQPATTVTGEDATDIIFSTSAGNEVGYRTTGSPEQVAATDANVPFTIDMALVDSVAQRIAGNTYYVVTPLWYDSAGAQAVEGLRHVPVTVTAVEPGNTMFPVRVVFDHGGRSYSMYMSLGHERTSTRNFDKLFAFSDPRKLYPRISDSNWDLIIHSKVAAGMTRDECRLALGAPRTVGQRPTTAGMVEYWSYDDGVYLLFEDGLLSQYRK